MTNPNAHPINVSKDKTTTRPLHWWDKGLRDGWKDNKEGPKNSGQYAESFNSLWDR